MSRCVLSIVLFAAILGGCESSPDIDMDRDTESDTLGDITMLDGEVYATNNDRSGHGGSQIDLLRFDTDGDLIDSMRLDINGMGYLSACTDGQGIFLQARGTGQMFRLTRDHGITWTRYDPVAGSDLVARGVAYAADVDSFVVLYNAPGTNSYTIQRFGPGFDGPVGSSRSFEWDTFDPATRDVIAVTWHEGRLWAIGPDEQGWLLQGVDADGDFSVNVRIIDIPDQVCGLASTPDGLLVATTNRLFHLRAVPAKGF